MCDFSTVSFIWVFIIRVALRRGITELLVSSAMTSRDCSGITVMSALMEDTLATTLWTELPGISFRK
uniref:Putative secreted protein n=1 Tax=Anopheles darlingi TaxID=43151 RepID=A0A2M4DBI7_ANODA